MGEYDNGFCCKNKLTKLEFGKRYVYLQIITSILLIILYFIVFSRTIYYWNNIFLHIIDFIASSICCGVLQVKLNISNNYVRFYSFFKIIFGITNFIIISIYIVSNLIKSIKVNNNDLDFNLALFFDLPISLFVLWYIKLSIKFFIVTKKIKNKENEDILVNKISEDNIIKPNNGNINKYGNNYNDNEQKFNKYKNNFSISNQNNDVKQFNGNDDHVFNEVNNQYIGGNNNNNQYIGGINNNNQYIGGINNNNQYIGGNNNNQAFNEINNNNNQAFNEVNKNLYIGGNSNNQVFNEINNNNNQGFNEINNNNNQIFNEINNNNNQIFNEVNNNNQAFNEVNNNQGFNEINNNNQAFNEVNNHNNIGEDYTNKDNNKQTFGGSYYK